MLALGMIVDNFFEHRSLLSDHLDIHLEAFLPVKLQDLPQWRMTHMGGPTSALDSLLDISTQTLPSTPQSDLRPVTQTSIDDHDAAASVSPTSPRCSEAISSGAPDSRAEKSVDIHPQHSILHVSSFESTGGVGSLDRLRLDPDVRGKPGKERFVAISEASDNDLLDMDSFSFQSPSPGTLFKGILAPGMSPSSLIAGSNSPVRHVSAHLFRNDAAPKFSEADVLQNLSFAHTSTIRSELTSSPKSDVVARLGLGDVIESGDAVDMHASNPDADGAPWEGIMTQVLLPPLRSSDDGNE